MTYRQFLHPECDEIEYVLGATPEVNDDDVIFVRLGVGEESIEIVADIPGRSVRLKWWRGSRMLVDIFRESAILMRFREAGGETFVDFTFETDDLAGRLHVQVAPVIGVEEATLLV